MNRPLFSPEELAELEAIDAAIDADDAGDDYTISDQLDAIAKLDSLTFRQRKRREYLRAYNRAHKQEIADYGRQYYAAHKAERDAYQRQYRSEHREQINAYHRAYYAANRERICARLREHSRRKKSVDEIEKAASEGQVPKAANQNKTPLL